MTPKPQKEYKNWCSKHQVVHKKHTWYASCRFPNKVKPQRNKWINGIIYPCKKIGCYPQIYIERVMHNKYRGIAIQLFEIKGETGFTISLTTRMARMLVKRINSAL